MKLGSILVLFFYPVPSSDAVTLVNPGFESVTNYGVFTTPASFAGWTVSAGTVGLPLSTLGNPQAGTQVLVPAYSASNGTSSVTQLISGFSIKAQYLVSFYTSAYSSTSYFGTSNATVSLGGASRSFSYTIPAEARQFGSVESPWILRSFSFTPTETTANLTISVTHGDFDPYVGFDSFSIQEVPEPSAFSLLLIVGGAIFFKRTR